MVMEYIEGKTLHEVLKVCKEKNLKIPHNIALHIIGEVLKGLDYAHSMLDENNVPLGIVHRDISPVNIMISYNGDVKILDFGVARSNIGMSKTAMGVVKGKVAYLSPEQVEGKSADARSDLFATGVVLYELICGKHPFIRHNEMLTIQAIRSDKPAIQGDLPRELKNMLKKSLKKSPYERYQSAHEFLTDITEFLSSQRAIVTARDIILFLERVFGSDVSDKITASISISPSYVRRRWRRLYRYKRAPAAIAVIAVISLGSYFILRNTNITGVTETGVTETKKVQKIKSLPQPKTSNLSITTHPDSAQVKIDGGDVGKTPLMVGNLEANKNYTIHIHKDGYKAISRNIFLGEGSLELSFKLEPAAEYGYVDFNAFPWARVYVDGRRVGDTTPLINIKLRVGKHKVRFVNPDLGLSKEIYISVEEGKRKKVLVNLDADR
jgi:serine/threonine-protein kinase